MVTELPPAENSVILSRDRRETTDLFLVPARPGLGWSDGLLMIREIYKKLFCLLPHRPSVSTPGERGPFKDAFVFEILAECEVIRPVTRQSDISYLQ